MVVISIFKEAAIFFNVSKRKFESAPSLVKLPISSLLKEQKTLIFFSFFSFSKALKAAKVLVLEKVKCLFLFL